jgi:hypothetical protein
LQHKYNTLIFATIQHKIEFALFYLILWFNIKHKTMKRAALFLSVFTVALISSCTLEETNGSNNENQQYSVDPGTIKPPVHGYETQSSAEVDPTTIKPPTHG